MDRLKAEEIVAGVLHEYVNGWYNSNSTFKELDVDSLELVRISMDIEDEFNKDVSKNGLVRFEFSKNDLAEIKTPNDIINMLEKL